MLTQAVTELSATLAASPDIETSWNRIVQQGTPIIESIDTQTVRVTFLWRQPEETEVERVYLDANSLTDHHAEQLSVMQRLGDSPVWFYTAEVSNTWRSSYSIIPVPKSVVDEFDYPGAGKEDSTRRTRWLGLLEHRIADPLNPLSAGVDTRRSVAEMPLAPVQFGWDAPVFRKSIQLTWASSTLDVERPVWIYETVDDGLTPLEERPLVILLDGRHWAEVMPAGAAFDRAVQTGKLKSCVLLAIDSVDNQRRSQELPCNRDYWSAVVDELLPQVRAVTPFSSDRTRTVVSGQSFGGLASMFAALEFPEHFALVASGSGSFWWPTGLKRGEDGPPGGDIAARIERDGVPDGLRVVLEVGKHESDMVGHSAAVAQALEAAGAQVSYRIFDGGHDWLCWRSALLDSVVELIGSP